MISAVNRPRRSNGNKAPAPSRPSPKGKAINTQGQLIDESDDSEGLIIADFSDAVDMVEQKVY
jgi:hypothetical protein